MTDFLEVSISEGRVRAIPVPLTSTDFQVISGPAILVGYSIRDGSGDAAQEGSAQVVSPAAGQTIISVTGLPAGDYQIQWTVELEGAPGAGDADNFKLTSSGGMNNHSINLGVAGEYPQAGIPATIGAGGNFKIVANAAGTVGVTYGGQLAVTPIAAGNAVVEIQDGNNPLAEVATSDSGVSSLWYGDAGLACRNEIFIHVVTGIIVGAVYVRYA